MSDIFISYAREDRAKAELLANALTRRGWSVWWDRQIPPGKSYDQIIEEAINSAKCIIVLWSEESVSSDWVRVEAEEGRRRGILIPVSLEAVRVPLAFRHVQAADLTDWNGDDQDERLTDLLQAISQLVPAGVLSDVQGSVRDVDRNEGGGAPVKGDRLHQPASIGRRLSSARRNRLFAVIALLAATLVLGTSSLLAMRWWLSNEGPQQRVGPVGPSRVYTVFLKGALASQAEAEREAREAQARYRADGEDRDIDVLFSTDYPATPEYDGLRPGFWVVYMGRYSREADARAEALRAEEKGFRGAYVRYLGDQRR